MTPLLRIDKLVKKFSQVVANDQLSLEVGHGEIHCLFGENGAGKSTLSSCIYGYHRPDEGTIHYKGEKVDFKSPIDAINVGIGMVHQHFVLVEEFTVLENIIVGTQKDGIRLREEQAREKVLKICESYEIDINLGSYIWELAVGQQQWVEILKALYLGAELLILDEPTAVLTPQESDRLFRIIHQMCERNLSIILISHKLNDVFQSDKVSVLRHGKIVATKITAETTPKELTTLMVGREVSLDVNKLPIPAGDTVLEVNNISALGDWGDYVLKDVTFNVSKHEILGVAGVSGNGQKQLFEVLTGIRRVTDGSVLLQNKNITNVSPRTILDMGVGSIPDDRFAEGLVSEFNIAENLILGWQNNFEYCRGPFIDKDKIYKLADKIIDEYQIATPSANVAVGKLSGGNAQRIILAREFLHSNSLILANQPTRGLDVGVIEYVYKILLQKRKDGFAIILASEELEDLFNLADRIAVFFKGQIMDILDPKTTSMEEVGLLMAGHVQASAGDKS